MIILKHLKLRMMIPRSPAIPELGEQVATVVWADQLKDDIYLVSFELAPGEYTSYFCQAKKEGGFALLEYANSPSVLRDCYTLLTQD